MEHLDIDRFICAFDDPYIGTFIFINEKRVFLKKSQIELNDGSFHPFQIGLIYKVDGKAIYVASKDGTFIVKAIFDENGINIFDTIHHGMRFLQIEKKIDSGLLYNPNYNL